jgi:hypothetical protein
MSGVSAIGLAVLTAFAGALSAADISGNAMPPAQQNAIVAKYCAVCHSDAHPNGRLSFEHFDAANADPGLVAIMAAKLRTGAFGASGQPLPDKATQAAFASAMKAESAGAESWVVDRTGGPVTASIVRQLPSTDKEAHGEPDLYRLMVTCDARTRAGHMDLEWSPGVPKQGREMSAAVDGKQRFTWKVEGNETMGNDQAGTSGPGAVAVAVPLPKKTLTVANLFPDETVEFPFSDLDKTARRQLSACFSK